MDQVALIKDKIDIVTLLSESISVKKAGRNFKALCPFHGEKSPSFVISPERQIWHCFGCGKGGDIYAFLMEYEHLEFPEALRTLAKRVGVTLEETKFESETSRKKEALYKLNFLAAEFYHYVLTRHPAGKRALVYLQNRGVSDKVIASFHLGFAPGVGTALTRYLQIKKSYQAEALVEAGLAFQKGADTVDFFRGRLMFPLSDHRDTIVGFSGRILADTPTGGPKYINTRETLVYHKGELFFGLNMTKDAIRKQNQVILVEGEFDVLSCFQHGIGNTVAVKGTALTEQQVALLARFAQKVTVCFDGDTAGQEAIKRSLPIIEKKGLTISVVVIPHGKDPDEALKTDAAAFKKAVREEQNVYDYLLTQTVKRVDKTTPEGKRIIAEDLLPVLATIENAIVKEHYLRKISSELETSYESICRELERVQERTRGKQVKVPRLKVQISREELLEEYLTSLIVQSPDPKAALQKAVAILSDTIAKERAYQKILSHLVTYFAHLDAFDHQRFVTQLPVELLPAFDKSFLRPLPHFAEVEKHEAEIRKTAEQLRMLYVKERIKDLAEKIKLKEAAGVEDHEAQLLKERYSRYVGMLQK